MNFFHLIKIRYFLLNYLKGVCKMNKPIAVFDAGLGSYAIVEAIKKAYPQ